MHDAVLNSGWQTAMVAIPFVFVMLVGVFRLDELIVAPKTSARRQRLAVAIDEDGRTTLCDPDGRPWRQTRGRG
jgi:hypothetical protein